MDLLWLMMVLWVWMGSSSPPPRPRDGRPRWTPAGQTHAIIPLTYLLPSHCTAALQNVPFCPLGCVGGL